MSILKLHNKVAVAALLLTLVGGGLFAQTAEKVKKSANGEAQQSAEQVQKVDKTEKPAKSEAEIKAEAEAKKAQLAEQQLLTDKLKNRKISSKSNQEASKPASKLMSMLAIVGVLGFACWFVFKKYLPKVRAASGKKICVIENASLGRGQGLCFVEAGSKKLLIGVTREKISLVADLTDAFADEQKPANFSEVLQKAAVCEQGDQAVETDK